MSLTTKVLIGLIAGLAVGIGLAGLGTDSALARNIIAVAEPAGTIFINAIRMTVIPLVVASLIVGVSSAPDPRAVGRIGARAIVIFVVLVSAACVFGIVLGVPLLGLFSLDPAAVEMLRAGAASAGESVAQGAESIPTAAEWLIALVPPNPVKAATDGAMLPLIIFSVAFAAALIGITNERRSPVVRFFEGVQDASLVLVRWILELAPVGVFALAIPLAARMGLAAAGALMGYVLIVSAISVLFMVVVLYPAAVALGRVSLREFARACLPAQGIAFSSRSSLASLPAMLESATDTLKLPQSITNFFIPLAASTFRVGAGIGQTIGVLFIAKLYGVDLSVAHLFSIGLTSMVTSFSVPGVPGGSIIVMVPVLMTAGIPIEGIGILLGVDTIPDMFRTTSNVTGDMAAATMLSRGERSA